MASATLLPFLVSGQGSPQPIDPADQLRKDRRAFQDQELITARRFARIFNPGDAPRIVWRDSEEIRRLGGDPTPRVRWFDSNLNESEAPNAPGRWAACVEGTAPNGTPLRRAMTLYARPKDFLLYPPPDPPSSWAHHPGPIAAPVWREHQEEVIRVFWDSVARSFLDSEAAGILVAGLAEAKQIGRAHV